MHVSGPGCSQQPCRQRARAAGLRPVSEAWHPLPSPPSVSSQHGNEVAETVVDSSVEFVESCFSRACGSLTDCQGEQ